MRFWFKRKNETPDPEEVLRQSIEAKLAVYEADSEQAKFETCDSVGVVVQSIDVDTDSPNFKSAWDQLKISREAAMRNKDAS